MGFIFTSKFNGLSKVELGFDLRTGKEFVTKQKVQRFVYSKEDNNTVLDGGINEMYLDKEGNVFLSFKDGVIWFDFRGSKWKRRSPG